MPKQVDIEIFPVAMTTIKLDALFDWFRHLDVDPKIVPRSEMVSDPELLIGYAAKRCYMSFEPGLNPNVTRVRENWNDYFNNLLASGHGSVFEHATYSFAIEGCTRVFTAEMNRHRAGCAISEGSLRYIRFDEIPYWLPESIRINEADPVSFAEKKLATQDVMHEVFEFCEKKYKELCKLWDIDDGNFGRKKALTSMFRRIIPMGVSTGGIWTLNVRALRHVIAMRSSQHAEEEIAHIITRIATMIMRSLPLALGDFKEDEHGFMVPEFKKI